MSDIRKETPAERAFRREATDALGLHPNTRWATCASHGQRARIEDAYAMNNIVRYDNGDITCEPSHPFCLGYCSRDDLKHAVLTRHGIKAAVAQDRIDRLLNLADAFDRLPPHAAGEEDDEFGPVTEAELDAARVVLRPPPSPAASQVAMEMPEGIATIVGVSRSVARGRTYSAESPIDRVDAIVWLADRLEAELSKKL